MNERPWEILENARTHYETEFSQLFKYKQHHEKKSQKYRWMNKIL
jgi:hypothetical protein